MFARGRPGRPERTLIMHTSAATRNNDKTMESDLSLEFLRVVEQAAIACAHTIHCRM